MISRVALGIALTSLTSCQNAEIEAHGIILVKSEEEQTITQETPDGNICDNPGSEMVGTNGSSSTPEESYEVPCQRSADNGYVHQKWGSRMPEVQ